MKFTAITAPKNWRGFAALTLALVAGLSFNEVLFKIAARYQAQVAQIAVKDLLDREELLQNFLLLGQAVENLQDLHLIQCTTMSSSQNPQLIEYVNFAQSEACAHPTASWFSPSLAVHQKLQAGNGHEIEAQYQVVLGRGFAIGLWGSRFLWIALIIVFWYAVRARFKHQIEIESVHTRALSEVAEQVSHDLVSPLATLDELLIEAQQVQIPEGLRFKLRNGIGKIRDIVNELKSRPNKLEFGSNTEGEMQKRSPELLSAVIDALVSEKCTEFRSKVGVQIYFHVDPKDFGLFSMVNALKLQRILSNLINNAAQALKNEKVQIDVSLSRLGESIQIEVKDDGVGIPNEVRSKLGKRGQTFRATGSGLGLFDAKTTVEQWTGEFVIDSRPGEGTAIRLILPRTIAPHWFLDSISLRTGQRVVVIDDDSGIHGIWKRRIDELPEIENIELLHFHSANSFKIWYASAQLDETSRIKKTSFFFDYELLGESENGLDLIDSHSLAERSALVTSRYDVPLIRERSSRLGVRILPKTMTSFVPIVCASPQSDRPDSVLIDDDPTYLMKWSKSARKHDKSLKTFSNAQGFLDLEWTFDRATPVFVDADLGEDSGVALTKTLFSLGFVDLHLATNYPASRFDLTSTPWIKSVRGKTPPWEVS